MISVLLYYIWTGRLLRNIGYLDLLVLEFLPLMFKFSFRFFKIPTFSFEPDLLFTEAIISSFCGKIEISPSVM